MGEGVVERGPLVVSSPGIGSCVVVALYDGRRGVGGLAHVMLPESDGVSGCVGDYWCADTAIDALLARLLSRGAAPADLVAKMAGGARMFATYGNGSPAVGARNILSVKRILARKGIPLVGSDVDGHHGRSVLFHLPSGRLVVKALGKEDKLF